MNFRSRQFVIGLSLLLAASQQGVWAQVPGSVRQDLTLPGQILEYGTTPDGKPKTDTKPAIPPATTPDIEQTKPTPEETIDPSLQRKIMINKINVEGVTLLDSRDVQQLVAPYQGKENSFIDLRELADKLTNAYREKGYLSSRVYIPPQTIQDGTVTLKASEGLVGSVKLENGKYFGKWAITNRINLTPGEPFNVNPLRTSMFRVNDNPDVKVKATLRAGTQPGTTDVDLSVTERFPIHLSGFYDNLGRRLIGTQRGGLMVANNNFTGIGDRTLTVLSWTGRSFGVTNHYEIPLGKSATKIGFDYAHSRLKLGKEFEELKVRGRATIYTPYISHEFYTSDNLRVSADLPFDFVNLRTTILGEDFTEDRLRVLRPSFTMEQFDRYGSTYFRNEFGIGLNIFSATTGNESEASRAGAGSKFFRYTGFLTRTQRLPLGTYGVFRAITQLSPDRLVSNEQLQIGGAFTVRGYKEGRLIGDNGLVLSSEWRIPAFVFPKTWKIPNTSYVLRDNIQAVTFADFGASWTNRPAPGIGASDYIFGIGVGVRARLTRFMVARVDMGIPLLRQWPDNNRPRLHFGLQSELF